MADGRLIDSHEWTDVDLDKVARFHDRGFSTEQIAAQLGRPPAQVSERLKIVVNRIGRFH